MHRVTIYELLDPTEIHGSRLCVADATFLRLFDAEAFAQGWEQLGNFVAERNE